MSDTAMAPEPAETPAQPEEQPGWHGRPVRRPRIRGRLVVLGLVPALALGAGGGVALLRADTSPQAPAHGSPLTRPFADLSVPAVAELPPVSEAAFATDSSAADRAAAGLTADLTRDQSPGARKTAPATVSIKDLDAALARRTTALRTKNEKAFLATFDTAQPALIKTERLLFRNLAKLPLVTPLYREAPAGGTATARRAYVGLIYQIKGVDLEPTVLSKLETWIRRNGRVVTTVVGSVPGHATTRYAPLDQLALTVRAGKNVTVVGGPDTAGSLAAIDAIAERAALAVHGVWGSRPGPSRFVVFATRDRRAIGTWFGASASPVEAIASTLPELAFLHPNRFAGARVIVNLSDVVSAQELYRVMRHEFTHAIDVRAQVVPVSETDQVLPAWAEEGFAAWVEELDLPLAASVYVHDLKALRSMWDRQLPPGSRAQFYAAGDRVAYNYAIADLLYRYVAKNYGNAKAIAFYAWYAAGHSDAARRVLGVEPDTFTTGWADWVQSVIG
jgi:hypothetical protein